MTTPAPTTTETDCVPEPPANRRAARLTLLALLLCAAWFLRSALMERNECLADPNHAQQLTHGDAGHYLDIAHAFGAGNLRMDYVLQRAHRQPLYPAALAIGARLFGDDPADLLFVNIALSTITVFFAGLWCWRLFRSALAGVTVAAALAINPFVLREGALQLLTEPLFTLCLVAAIVQLLRFFAQHRRSNAVWASLLLGLVYLTRPNGLFLWAAAMLVTTAVLLWRWRRQPDREHGREAWRTPLGCGFVFVVVTIPSWLPRLWYWGNPIYHGYLPNYLWVDTYAEGHVSGPPRFTMHDYVANHTWSDAWHRLLQGLQAVFVDVPRSQLTMQLSLLMAAGVLLALLARRRDLLLLLAVFLMQITPIAWTQLSNPSARIPAAATLPFGIFYAAFAASIVQVAARRLWSKRRGSTGGTL